ncbi:LysR family transcriptional regulator [Lactobacillus xylocopicola]|uniref:LysR family transcriptional regulator n=1 Tax=Lactobacillus xylocopicola TaxID=2976676 RepID=A0ABN6SMJ1_9LACO|nr:LysR family transcriptional regulator [Lactobacillus xylocopicola]BDR60948.1 LysR family transcriptional regulator [Lactobacillus xylocopicola]
MDNEQLKVFLAVAQQGSFGRVADQRYVTQRAVSRQIARLENELGIKLFERANNRISLSQAGKYFAGRVQDYLNNFDATVIELKKIAKATGNTLSIGYFSIFDAFIMEKEIINYQTQKLKPEIDFSTTEESVEHLLADLALNKLDCAYINQYGSYDIPQAELYDFVPVYANEMVMGISKQNVLSKKQYLTEKDLEGQTLFYYSHENSDFMRKTFTATLHKNMNNYQIMRVSSIEQLMTSTALNQGLAYIPKGLINQIMRRDPEIVYRRFHSQQKQQYAMQLIYLKNNQSKALKSFVRSIKKLKI